jgi:5'-AMP-activated protein kinase, catalytic alpha subunit
MSNIKNFSAKVPDVLGDYLVTKKLTGAETVATACYAKHITTEKRFVMKVLPKCTGAKTTAQYFREVSLQRLHPHPRVVPCIEEMYSSTHLLVVFADVHTATLADFVGCRGPLPEVEARRIFEQVVQAMAFWHEHGVAHWNLSPHEVYVDVHFNAKVSGFGIGNLRIGHDKLCSIAPEMRKRSPYACKGLTVDIWFCGTLLHYMLTGTPPSKVVTCEDGTTAQGFEPTVVDLLESMLQKDPRDRIAAKEILLHAWMKKDADRVEEMSDSSASLTLGHSRSISTSRDVDCPDG